jgi:hypothetical protein
MGAAVRQANKTNNPDITGTPIKRNSHVPSVLAQDNSCKNYRGLMHLAGKAELAILVHIYWDNILRTKLALENHLRNRVLDVLLDGAF